MRYLLSGAFIAAALLAGALLIKPASAQTFGTFTDAYLANRAIKEHNAELCTSGRQLQAETEAFSAGRWKPFDPPKKHPCYNKPRFRK